MDWKICGIPAAGVIAATLASMEEETPGGRNPRELGRVKWSRDLDKTLQAARARDVPVFALFQEVPG